MIEQELFLTPFIALWNELSKTKLIDHQPSTITINHRPSPSPSPTPIIDHRHRHRTKKHKRKNLPYHTIRMATKPATEEQKDDWRKSVTQSYRSSEIREISKVLAALEPGATVASKMMLAMRFEDSIFQSSDSLADYRKRLTKRLKKLQKSYTPTQSANIQEKNNEKMERDLKVRFGEHLKYIVGNAPVAIEALREKQGNEKADNLKQHTDSIHQWSVEIGLLPEQGNFRKRRPR